jgi:hypothetical protein
MDLAHFCLGFAGAFPALALSLMFLCMGLAHARLRVARGFASVLSGFCLALPAHAKQRLIHMDLGAWHFCRARIQFCLGFAAFCRSLPRSLVPVLLRRGADQSVCLSVCLAPAAAWGRGHCFLARVLWGMGFGVLTSGQNLNPLGQQWVRGTLGACSHKGSGADPILIRILFLDQK